MKRKRLIPGLGTLSVLTTLAAIVTSMFVVGAEMFSPGPLNGRVSRVARTGEPKGRPSSHAAFARQCSACHVSPWSGRTMSDQCAGCHDVIRDQIAQGGGLHGKMANASACMSCHTEHRGSGAEITSFHLFDHRHTEFPLTGGHVGVSCGKCHEPGHYKVTNRQCVNCHVEPLSHVREQFSKDCAQCHSTTGWQTTSFSHRFPIHHKQAMQKGGCAICHDAGKPKAEYTCYHCHAHDPDRERRRHQRKGITEAIDRCAGCHPDGRKRQRADLGNDILGEFAMLSERTFRPAYCGADCPANRVP